MPLAVTHVLLTIILLDLFKDYIVNNKDLLSLNTLFIGGLAGLLPDIDIPLSWFLGFFGKEIVHGSFTHTPWFAALFMIPGLIFLNRKENKRAAIYFVISFGVLFHVFLDWFLGGGMHSGVMWLFPLSMQTFRLHLFDIVGFGARASAGLDAIILLGWLWHEEVKHRISDFI